MRVLLGVDGSTPSILAQHLVAGMPWPRGTAVRAVSVVVPPVAILAASTPGLYISPDTLAEMENERIDHAHRVVQAADHALKDRGLVVETAVLRGPAARELTDDAITWSADMIAVGSHGHGMLAGLLLGSVSAEIVDHAPCPVLIARRPTVTKVLVAVDGSTAAAQAVTLLASWAVFSALPTTVVTVLSTLEPEGSASMPEVQSALDTARERLASGLRAHAEGVAGSAADRLRAAGIPATSQVLEGKPAEQIVVMAEQDATDLIVVGTRGLTGLARLRLGSTARGVLHTASVSVLVVPVHAVSSSEHRR